MTALTARRLPPWMARVYVKAVQRSIVRSYPGQMTARDRSREPEPDYDGLVARFKQYARDGRTPVELAIWLREHLIRIQGEGFSGFTYVVCLVKAFGLDVGTAQQFLRWADLEWGGSLTDSELNELLTSVIERSVARIRQAGSH